MPILNPRNQKKVLLKHGSEMKQIHDEYYDCVVFKNEIEGRIYEKKVYKTHVKNILKKYKLSSVDEILFLLHRYCGELIHTCEFCGYEKTKITTRTKTESFNECTCAGRCNKCNKIYKRYSSYHNGLCHDCYWDGLEVDMTQQQFSEVTYVIFNLKNTLGWLVDNVKNLEDSKTLINFFDEYYILFKEIHESLK